MSVAFWWCHTEGCPNYGRARKMDVKVGVCPSCMQPMKLAAPGELPSVVHEVDEENQGSLLDES